MCRIQLYDNDDDDDHDSVYHFIYYTLSIYYDIFVYYYILYITVYHYILLYITVIRACIMIALVRSNPATHPTQPTQPIQPGNRQTREVFSFSSPYQNLRGLGSLARRNITGVALVVSGLLALLFIAR